jgi:hypothetical protein
VGVQVDITTKGQARRQLDTRTDRCLSIPMDRNVDKKTAGQMKIYLDVNDRKIDKYGRTINKQQGIKVNQ